MELQSPKNGINLSSAKSKLKSKSAAKLSFKKKESPVSEIIFITIFPPRECGIATYSEDLILAIKNKFASSFSIKIVALELHNEKHDYKEPIYAVLETDNSDSYVKLAKKINDDSKLKVVLLQHEFGLFNNNETDLISFLNAVKKPKIVVYHTILPNPSEKFKMNVQNIDKAANAFIVMTNNSARMLEMDYGVLAEKISVIPHGTHLVEHVDKKMLKLKFGLDGRKVVSTFGLLGSGKCLETTINALPSIRKVHPDILFLIIGKTHPTVYKNEGEIYRDSLKTRIKELDLEQNVQFVDKYLSLDVLLEYLQLTDIYLFTSKDRNQAVSGTFSYAISCGCPIISTPIPHAIEVLKEGAGVIVDFENPKQLSEQVIRLFNDDTLRKSIGSHGIHKIAPTAWQNSALAHVYLFRNVSDEAIPLKYRIPQLNLKHFKNLTTSFGMIQFAVINHPDLSSGYTLDDNARALVAMCQHYEVTNEQSDLEYITIYFNFIKFCLQPQGHFLNYVDIDKKFTKQNDENIADANGRAIWALGYLISKGDLLPHEFNESVFETMKLALQNVHTINSTRAMAFIIKGIYYSNSYKYSADNVSKIRYFADKLVQMYKHEAKDSWKWYEGFLTYANSILPEAMLCTHLATNVEDYKIIAKESFDFLLSKIYKNDRIRVISNESWLIKNKEINYEKFGGEQPIDVSYTIMALGKFYDFFKENDYLQKIKIGFTWFLGNNHLNQIIYNPATGGCYDGLEKDYINLNQGAESTVSYLMARLTMEGYLDNDEDKIIHQIKNDYEATLT